VVLRKERQRLRPLLVLVKAVRGPVSVLADNALVLDVGDKT
jgi:hypothetical protein